MTKRSKRSFKPNVEKPVRPLHFKGEGAKYIGFTEPEWPSLDVQNEWSRDEYENQLHAGFCWYTATSADKDGAELALKALGASGHFPELARVLKTSNLNIPHTSAWMIRMIQMGLKLRYKEAKIIVRDIHKCLDNLKITIPTSGPVVVKPNIQDFISAKLRRARGEMDSAFDQFVESGYKKSPRTVMNILSDPEISVPGNRVKDLIAYANGYLTEYKAAMAGKNDLIAEAYAHLGKRELKASINWWETAITDITHFGIAKKSVRKTRKRKALTPEKVVAKMRYLKAHTELGLTSIDPTQILKASTLWVLNTKTRKIGRFVALPNSTLDVKGNRILNLDPTKSTQKTLRKPKEQIAQFVNLGKGALAKWFTEIKSVETKLRDSMNNETILLRTAR